jgi:CBS-domain-containing membrane protein
MNCHGGELLVSFSTKWSITGSPAYSERSRRLPAGFPQTVPVWAPMALAQPHPSMTDVARRMATNRIHCLVVWNEPARNERADLWGVVSDLDLVKVAATAFG